MKNTQAFISANRERFLAELLDFLRIPSISADPAYAGSVRNAAEWLASKLKEAGLDQVRLEETDGFPIVYGEKMVDPAAPTILVYGHYDVQPADPLDLWESPPFEPVIKNEVIYARGACDDKGPGVYACEGL
jgi:acetylornithine deacetylase/succinyl-diaminopimelate desuccinylase-like protein